MADFETLASPTLISRKIWVAEKSQNFYKRCVMIAKNSVKSKCEYVNWKVNTFSRKNYILSVFCISVSFSGALAVLVTIQLLVALSLANLISRKDSPPTFLIWPLQSTWRNVLCLTDAPLVGQVCLEFDMIQWPTLFIIVNLNLLPNLRNQISKFGSFIISFRCSLCYEWESFFLHIYKAHEFLKVIGVPFIVCCLDINKPFYIHYSPLASPHFLWQCNKNLSNSELSFGTHIFCTLRKRLNRVQK